MSTQVIYRPPISHRSLRSKLVWALALIAAAGIGAGVVAVTQGGSDAGLANSRSAQVPTSPVATSNTCPGDGGALFAAVASMPSDASATSLFGQLSPATQALLTATARGSAATNSAPAVPDPATLAGALARVGPSDSAAIMSSLPAQTQAAIAATPTALACG